MKPYDYFTTLTCKLYKFDNLIIYMRIVLSRHYVCLIKNNNHANKVVLETMNLV